MRQRTSTQDFECEAKSHAEEMRGLGWVKDAAKNKNSEDEIERFETEAKSNAEEMRHGLGE